MKQAALALHNYESSKKAFPPFCELPRTTTFQPFSAQARILPYIEEEALAKLIDFDVAVPFTTHPEVAQARVGPFMCPSEENDRVRQKHRRARVVYSQVQANDCSEGTTSIRIQSAIMIQDEPRTEYLFQSPKAKVVRILVGREQGNWESRSARVISQLDVWPTTAVRSLLRNS
jgi:hypothetical protein